MDAKNQLLRRCGALSGSAKALALKVHEFAELPMQEQQSAALMKQTLTQHGFTIQREFELIPTAFAAAFGEGSPTIGLLAEYDGLPNCGAKGRKPGHGCGHNLLGAASAFAAVALAKQMQAEGIPGTVKLFGCPAEETLIGKVYMARDGAFDDLDACLAWHPGAGTSVNNGSGTAMDSLTYEFYGKTSHAAGDPHNGRSALDAIEIMNVAVNFLREHVASNVRIHYAIMDGGKAPNVVPPYARSWYYIRGRDREQVAEISARVHRCAKAAAMATETRMKRKILSGVYDRLPNEALAKAMDANLRLVGPPRFSKADAEFAKSLGLSGEFSSKVSDISTTRGSGSSDEANVSWITPLIVLSAACWAKGTPGHHYLIHEQARAAAAMKGLAVAVKTLALTAYDLVTDADLRKRAREEFEKTRDGRAYDPIVPKRQKAPIEDRIP